MEGEGEGEGVRALLSRQDRVERLWNHRRHRPTDVVEETRLASPRLASSNPG